MAVPTNPGDLAAASACYDGIPPARQNAAIIYLLNNSQDSPQSVNQIMAGAACYQGIPEGMTDAVIVYLLAGILAANP